jgi:amidase
MSEPDALHEGGDAVAGDVVLDVAGLRAAYGHVPVLHGIDFQLKAGEAVGIVGHNGVGKTTFLKTLIGLVPTTAGRISIDGIDVTRMKAARPQPPRHRLRAAGARHPARPDRAREPSPRLDRRLGRDRAGAIERILDTLPRLKSILDRKGGALSGGEQQILALGRALIAVPWLLLLDEPSEGIQPSIVQEIGEILAGLRKRDRLSLVVVEQNLDLVLDVADRIVVVERGRIEREIDAHTAQAGGIAELLGMGKMRTSRAAPATAPRSAPAPRPASSSTVAASSRPVPRPAPAPATAPARAASAVSRLPAPAAAPSRGDPMSIKRPTLEQLSEIVASLHMSMSDHEVGDYLEVLEGTMQAYDRVDALPDYLPEVRYPRTPGTRPSAAENPLGAWYVKSEVKGAPYGPLAGKRVVLKDNICLAGVPMMNGASTLEGYVPDVDATVATRILDAGGTIAGKAHCEYFCLSAAATPRRRARCTTRTRSAIRRAARRAAAPRSSAPARSRWRSAATRAARCACRARSAAATA